MVEKKLQNGDNLLQQAGHDKQQFSFALLAYHGAIEDFFRQKLAAEIAEFEKTELSGRSSGWIDLINLWQKKYDLSPYEKSNILSKNQIRQQAAHGSFVEVERSEAETYGNFVKNFIQQNSSSRKAYTAPAPPQSRPARPTVVNTPSPHSVTTATPSRWASCLKRVVIIIFLFSLVSIWLALTISNNLKTINGQTDPNTIQDNSRENDSSLNERNNSRTSESQISTPNSSDPTTNGNITKIRVTAGNSNLRSGPGEEFDPIGVAPNDTEYEVLETSPNQDWFKIELDTGVVGWIGSTRVTTISP